MEFERIAEKDLSDWLNDADRQPLVLRGARQVGKTWLVRRLAKSNGKTLIELNLEKNPEYAKLFCDNSPKATLVRIEAMLNQPIDWDNSILFLDEIQTFPQLLAKLRWFFEELPQLPVVVTGSLLEFVLKDHTFSMPVGRINYYHLEPLSFEEFLMAQGEDKILDFILSYTLEVDFPVVLHDKLMRLFKNYVLVGGMPKAVSSWIQHQSYPKMSKVHHDLLSTYRDDFTKYAGKISQERLEEVLLAVPKMLGNKFKYSKVNADISSHTLKKALTLLNKARLCHRVTACEGGGVPLSAGKKEKIFKVVFLDVGLVSASLGLSMKYLDLPNALSLSNQGEIAEQVVGQLLRTVEPYYIEPSLYYWMRDKAGSMAEVDYVMQHADEVVPIEVKAGKTGTLKSLHLFMAEKKFKKAVRVNGGLPSVVPVRYPFPGMVAEYELISLPFYLVGQMHRFLSEGESEYDPSLKL